jgi:hypothetical protein
MVHEFAGSKFLKKKANPVGWLCAQKRFVTGFVKTMRRYDRHYDKKGSQQQLLPLPSYLLLLDDDTYYNMKLLSAYLEGKDPQIPYVTVGCRVNVCRGKRVHPHGGFGTLFSKGSLARLLRPIYCINKMPSHSMPNSLATSITNTTKNDKETAFLWWEGTITYGERVCKTIERNLIKERPHFKDGMSIVDLMEAYALAQPFENHKEWDTGFCLNSDWFFGFIIDHYVVPSYQAIEGSDLKAGFEGGSTGICKNDGDKCNATGLIACHYQTPTHMERLHADRIIMEDME